MATEAACSDGKPQCKYWEKCYQKSSLHRQTYLHPRVVPSVSKRKLTAKRIMQHTISDSESEDGEPVKGKKMKTSSSLSSDKSHPSSFDVAPTLHRKRSEHQMNKTPKAARKPQSKANSPSSMPGCRPKRQIPEKKLYTRPVPELMLAHKYEKMNIDPRDWWMSEKLDGVRAYWSGVNFYSRLKNQFFSPEFFNKELPEEMTLDGELFVGRGKFQETVSIVKSHAMNEEQWKSIKFYVFDVPSLGSRPFEERIQAAKDYFKLNPSEYVVVLDQIKVKNQGHLDSELHRIEGLGGEGLMIRKPKSTYEHCRSHALLKIKSFYDAEAKVIGYESGKGRNVGLVGALRCVMQCGKKFSVGSGLKDKDRRKPPKIGAIITYKFQELTKSGSPRFPSYLGIAIDKIEAKDAVIRPKKEEQ